MAVDSSGCTATLVGITRRRRPHSSAAAAAAAFVYVCTCVRACLCVCMCARARVRVCVLCRRTTGGRSGCGGGGVGRASVSVRYGSEGYRAPVPPPSLLANHVISNPFVRSCFVARVRRCARASVRPSVFHSVFVAPRYHCCCLCLRFVSSCISVRPKSRFCEHNTTQFIGRVFNNKKKLRARRPLAFRVRCSPSHPKPPPDRQTSLVATRRACCLAAVGLPPLYVCDFRHIHTPTVY